ncbi:MAG: metallophosphoesterase, partial [Planctomycetota bacterium]
MATWILGDIHGCASELAALLERIAPGPDDAIVSCGDLVHRGPDPAGVCDLLAAHGARFVLGNHELRVLERVGIAPRRHDGADRGPT